MPAMEEAKRLMEKATGLRRLTSDRLGELVRPAQPETARFSDDGFTPNHPRWPLVLYPSAVRLPEECDPAAVFEDLFSANGWGKSWRNGVYDFTHHHSQIHEVLGVARGSAQVLFGGDSGRAFRVTAGDVAILPAGTGHQCLWHSTDLVVIGAYPKTGRFDLCRGSKAEHDKALKSIPQVPLPDSDPVFGKEGPLLRLWGN